MREAHRRLWAVASVMATFGQQSSAVITDVVVAAAMADEFPTTMEGNVRDDSATQRQGEVVAGCQQALTGSSDKGAVPFSTGRALLSRIAGGYMVGDLRL